MGAKQNSIAKSRKHQHDAILEEASKSGIRVVDVSVIGDPSVAGLAGSMIKAFLGGKVDVDDAQVFTLQSQGISHVYIQPYEGLSVVPGYHEATVNGSVATAATFTAKSFGRHRWLDSDGRQADVFNHNLALKRAVKSLKWKWQIGTSVIELPWTLRLTPTAEGTTHIVMRAGRYGGVTSYKIGMSVFLEVIHAVFAVIAEDAPFLHESS
jgi:hypothetical protein